MPWGISPVEFTPPESDAFPDFLQWQDNGENLGDTAASTVNATNGIKAERGVGEDANVITLSATPYMISWREIDGDGDVLPTDANNGIVMLANTGAPVLRIDDGVLPVGAAIIVLQKGAAQVDIVPSSGLNIVYPTDRFISALAGQGAIITLIGGPADAGEVVLCGDMASLPT
jgi:hypothetical protein